MTEVLISHFNYLLNLFFSHPVGIFSYNISNSAILRELSSNCLLFIEIIIFVGWVDKPIEYHTERCTDIIFSTGYGFLSLLKLNFFSFIITCHSSGVLTMYTCYQVLDKTRGRLSFIQYMVVRYLRYDFIINLTKTNLKTNQLNGNNQKVNDQILKYYCYYFLYLQLFQVYLLNHVNRLTMITEFNVNKLWISSFLVS